MNRYTLTPLLALSIVVLLVVACAAAPVAAAAPTTRAALSIYTPTSAYSTKPFTLTGKLSTGAARLGVSDSLVTVYASTNGKKWTAVGTDWTDDDGYYTVTTSQQTTGTYYYKATFAGDRVFKTVTSPVMTLPVATLPPGPTAMFWATFDSYNQYTQTAKWTIDATTSTGSSISSYVLEYAYTDAAGIAQVKTTTLTGGTGIVTVSPITASPVTMTLTVTDVAGQSATSETQTAYRPHTVFISTDDLSGPTGVVDSQSVLNIHVGTKVTLTATEGHWYVYDTFTGKYLYEDADTPWVTFTVTSMHNYQLFSEVGPMTGWGATVISEG